MLVLISLRFKSRLIIYVQIFASHAIGGVVGNILTGIFAQASVAGFDGRTRIKGGWLDHNWAQVGFQLANSVAGMSYSFVMTVRNFILYAWSCQVTDSLHQTLILWAMHYIPALCLRCNEETEIVGVDDGQMGEYAYDYVSVDLELGSQPIYSENIGANGGDREPIMRQRHGATASIPG
jgi:Amt family ammonium transporter